MVHMLDTGIEEDVIKFEEKKVSVKRQYLLKFLYEKKLYFIGIFNITRKTIGSIEDISLDGKRYDIQKNKYKYTLQIGDGYHQDSYIEGWKFIGIPNMNPMDNDSGQYVSFIIGMDTNGNKIKSTYNKEPMYKLVAFRKAVLNKYYDDTKKYEITYSSIKCVSSWLLRIANSHPQYVFVYLCHLSDIPYKEQQHWEIYNEYTDEKLADTDFLRSVCGEFADPTEPAERFKFTFEQFNTSWKEKYDWNLFKELADADKHCINSLHVPTTENQQEFDTQILYLTKIMIDSINVQEIKRFVIYEKNDKSIKLLEKFLHENSVKEHASLIKILKDLQNLRSSSIAHRKSTNYKNISNAMYVETNSHIDTFIKILNDSTDVLLFLGKNLVIK